MEKRFTIAFYFFPILFVLPLLFIPFLEKKSESAPESETETGPLIEEESASMPPCNCTVTQGSFTSPLPFMSTFGSATAFYSYGTPIATSANTGLEMSETMLIMMHEDLTNGATSLIIILDQGNDGTGGNASITFNCLPSSAYVAFSDEPGELAGSPPTITGNFNWNACCTDGGIIGGAGCGYTITINPNINSGINAFSLVYGSPSTPTYVSMPQLNCPITINCGGAACCEEAFEFTATTQNASCEDSADGSVDLTTDCATTPIFQWSNGSASEDLFGVNPGNYTVTITDANGCSQIGSYTVDADSPSPQPFISGPSEFCAGEPVELDAGGPYTQYQWSNGFAGSPIIVTTPGTYTVTVTNFAGCTGTATTTITQNPLPEPEIMGPNTVCINDTVTLDAGPGFSNYQWSSGESTQSIEASLLGSYFVTVTNSFGCTAFDFVILTPISTPFPMISGPTNVCAGSPITLNGGAGYSTYQWSTGAGTQSISTASAGNYTLTVTNAEGCTGTDSQQVTANPADSILLFQTSCNPADTGIFISQYENQYGCDSLEILTVAYSESDSVFLTNQTCNPQDTGVFYQVFTNQYGCDSIETLTVTLLPADSVILVQSSCSPQDTGTVVQVWSNQFGCDSLVATTTILLPTDTVQVFMQSCDPANAGVTQELLVNSYGCDSLVVTTTEFILVDTTNLQDQTCDPQSAGVFEELLIGSDGCDSLVITTISLLFSDTTFLEAITCDSAQAGVSEILLFNEDGCDSLIITNTTYIPPDTTLLFAESCNPAQTGVFEELLSNVYGCDSVLITTVSLLPSDTTYISQTSCDPAQAGTQELLLANQFGCDSLLVITTSYAEADSTVINGTTCDPAEAGVFVEILVSTDGCDSVITTTILLLPSDTVQVMAESCDPANVGISETLLTNQYGCDSLVITTTTLLPSDTTYLQAITCDFNQAGLSEEILPNQYGCDSLIVTNTTYSPPDTTLLVGETCDPGQAGTLTEVLQNALGCDSVLITTINLLPSDTTIVQAYSCDPAQVGTSEVLLTNGYGCDSLVITHTDQLPIDTTWFYFGSCLPADTGLVVTIFSNQSGCDSLVFEQTNLLPPSACQLNAQIQGDTIGCQAATGSLWLTFFNGIPPYQYTWTEPGGNSGTGVVNQQGQPQEISGLPPGTYTFDVIDPNGLTTSLTGVVFQPDALVIDLQLETDYNGYGVSCFGAFDGSASVAVLGGGLPPYSYAWSNGSLTPQLTGLGAGPVSVTVTGAEGCQAIASVLLESPAELQFALSVADPDCFSDGLGAIHVDPVNGGVGPYQYALNGGSMQNNPLFNDLGSGDYLVEVQDANGCIATAYATVSPFTQLYVFLGDDEHIEYGDSVTLIPVTNLPLEQLESIDWGGVDCPGCTRVTVSPELTTLYSVTIVDSLGCTASDELQVFVKKDFPYYVPNAFTPDFNGINDNFTIYSGRQVVRIRELQIFDRWGEAVFTGFNLPPNDPNYGWDGTYRGEPMDAAVFAYYAILEFIDGSTELIKGDVTLIR